MPKITEDEFFNFCKEYKYIFKSGMICCWENELYAWLREKDVIEELKDENEDDKKTTCL